MKKTDLLKRGALGALVGGTFLNSGASVAAQEEIAAAGNGGTAEADANGGAAALGDINSGGNAGNAIGTGDTGGADINGGSVANATDVDVSVLGGTGIADASGGDYNIAFLDEAGFLS
jgi:hypothetical protein